MPRRTTNDPAIGQRIRDRRNLLGWSIRFAADRAADHPHQPRASAVRGGASLVFAEDLPETVSAKGEASF
jgi:hypothetical protein